ncbi:MAG TPA: arylsulfatase [Planctomycetota bacterium]|nr:arylsulfatase [Planctomycetota bacterium]
MTSHHSPGSPRDPQAYRSLIFTLPFLLAAYAGTGEATDGGGRRLDGTADPLEANSLPGSAAGSDAQMERFTLQQALDDLPPESAHLLPEHQPTVPRVRAPRNVVVILADDMGLASLHAEHAGSGLPTPHLDRLAAQGLSFTDAHSGSAVCSPTRYGLLTGRYAWRTQMKSGIVAKWGPPLIAEDRMTLADVAQAAGLATACIGKWHLGWRWPKQGGGTTRRPDEIDYGQSIGGGALEAGFDHYFGDDVPNWPPYVWIEDDRALAVPSGHMEEDDGNGVRAGPMTPDWSLEAVLPELTARCVQFIKDRAKAEERFLLYFPMTSPHTPINPSKEFRGKSGVSLYADFLLETDWSVGQVLDALEQCGLSEDTLVIFTADNGTSPKADFASLSAGGVDLRAGWRGYKADVWEGGHRVPFLVRWPGVVEPGTRSGEPIVLTDVMATVADALHVDLDADMAEDSVSLLPMFSDSPPDAPLHDAIINHSSSGWFAIRTTRWKLCFCPGSGGWSEPRGARQAEKLGLPSVQLYDKETDREEQHNLADKMPERVEALTTLMRDVIGRSPLDGPAWWSRLPWPEPTTPE